MGKVQAAEALAVKGQERTKYDIKSKKRGNSSE